jgi:hypothetical protein
MKPLTFYLSFTISPELESYLGSISPLEKIEEGCRAVSMGSIGLAYPQYTIPNTSFAAEIHSLSPRNLARLGASLINVAVDELEWDNLAHEHRDIEQMEVKPMEGIEIVSIKEVPA